MAYNAVIMTVELPSRPCEHCGEGFQPRRPWQRFCKKSCGQQVRIERYRQRHEVTVENVRCAYRHKGHHLAPEKR